MNYTIILEMFEQFLNPGDIVSVITSCYHFGILQMKRCVWKCEHSAFYFPGFYFIQIFCLKRKICEINCFGSYQFYIALCKSDVYLPMIPLMKYLKNVENILEPLLQMNVPIKTYAQCTFFFSSLYLKRKKKREKKKKKNRNKGENRDR